MVHLKVSTCTNIRDATYRKFPEIRKFQIESKNFRKNETVSQDTQIIDQKGGKVLEKREMYQNSLIKNQMAIYSILHCI